MCIENANFDSDMLQYLVGGVVLLWLVKWYRSLFKGYENVDKMFPGPPALPFIGNALMFIGDPQSCLKGLLSLGTYKRSVRIWLAHRLGVILQAPSEIECLLNSKHIKKASIYDSFLPWIGRGLLMSYGEKWKQHRKLLTPAFHFKILESFLDVFNKNGEILLEQIEKKVGVAGFNVLDYIKLYALDNISETSMGVTIGAQLNPNCELNQAIKTMCRIVVLRLCRPHYYFETFFNLTKYRKRQEQALNVIHSFSNGVIKRRRQQRAESNGREASEDCNELGMKTKKSFLDILLDVADEGLLTSEELQNEVDTFIFAGHDSITSAISFCIYNLAHHEEYQTLVYKEQAEIFKDDITRSCSPEDLSKMKYLDMVCKESLRLHPSGALIGRLLEEDLQLDDHTIIPKGAEVMVAILNLHRNPDVWERPDEFYPDHFHPEAVSKRHPYAYIPFSGGPRSCIGMKYAMMEMKAALSKIIRKFELRPSNPKVDLVLIGEVTLQSQSGQHISLALRKHCSENL